MREWLDMLHSDGEQHETKVLRALINKAAEGDVPAIKEILDSAYGKNTDKQELTGSNGNPLSVILSTLDGATAGLPDGE
jgi:hypothetical protein